MSIEQKLAARYPFPSLLLSGGGGGAILASISFAYLIQSFRPQVGVDASRQFHRSVRLDCSSRNRLFDFTQTVVDVVLDSGTRLTIRCL